MNFTEKKFFYNVDFFRFLFSIIIVYYHILHAVIMKYVENIPNSFVYTNLAHNSYKAYIIVEYFFIIAGFFLFITISKKPNLNFTDFVKEKIIRLWPVLFFSLILSVIFFKLKIYTAIINACFLQCIGVTLLYNGYNWYISSFFWGIIFYFYILKNFDRKYAHLIIALCIYFSLVGIVNYSHGAFSPRETFYNFFNMGFLRALAGLGIGYFIGCYYNEAKNYIVEYSSKITKTLSFIIYSIIEFGCVYFLIFNSIFHKLKYGNSLIFLVIFSILLISLVLKKGLISRLLDNKILGFCGKYAYSIYVMQQMSFYIMQKTIWKCPELLNNVPICIFISLLFSIMLGIVTYYIIEKPVGKLLKNIFYNKKIQKINI